MIAIYNAMALYGRPQDLDVITTEFFLFHGMILGGLGGAGPWSFDSYFDWHRIPHTGYCDYDSLLQNVSDGDIVVFTVMNSQSDLSQGFHTMAAQYNNGAFTVYNIYSNMTTSCTLTTLNSVYRDSLWIYGYILK